MDDVTSRTGGSHESTRVGGRLRALLLGCGEDDQRRLVSAMQEGGRDPVVDGVANLIGLRASLSSRSWDVLLVASAAPPPSLEESIRVARESDPDVPILLVAPRIGPSAAAAAARAGLSAFVSRDDLDGLLPAIRRELQSVQEQSRERQLQERHREAGRLSSALVHAGRELIAPLDTNILLDRLAGLVRELLPCSSCHVLLFDTPTDLFIVRASSGGASSLRDADSVAAVSQASLLPILERLRHDDVAALGEELAMPDLLRQRWGAKRGLAAALRHGSEVFGLVAACSESDAGELPASHSPILRGIARLASLALENARLADELVRANRLKSEFVATMSHELRTPLNVIIGFNDLLLEDEFGSLSDEQSDVLRRIDRSAHELLDLINATLDLSRLEAGQLRLDLGDVSFPDLLRDLRAETASLHSRKPEVQLDWQIGPHLPTIRSDGLKIRVILKNLLSNAVKFTEQGTIRIRARRSGEGVEISVTDTGIGIPRESMEEIFEPFRSGAGATNMGVGLGLYVVRRLLAEVGGTIQVESEPGTGSTFRVHFPPAVGEKPGGDPLGKD